MDIAPQGLLGLALTPLSLPAMVPTGIEVFALHAAADCHFAIDTLACLSIDEQARYARYRHRRDAWRYANSRCVLRYLLSERLGISAEKIYFDFGAAGKPFIQGAQQWHFNLSHSEGTTLFALSPSHALGIDIEAHSMQHPTQAIARQAFSLTERLQLQVGDATSFYTIWTAKEAALKAWGCGLGGIDLRALSVCPGNTAEMRVTHNGTLPGAPRVWQLAAPSGYSAALAVGQTEH